MPYSSSAPFWSGTLVEAFEDTNWFSVVAHSSLETLGGRRSTCCLPRSLLGRLPSASWAPPELAPAFALDPKLELRLQHHLEEHEVARPHHQDWFPWVLQHHFEYDLLLHLPACKMANSYSCHHQVVGVQEGSEVISSGGLTTTVERMNLPAVRGWVLAGSTHPHCWTQNTDVFKRMIPVTSVPSFELSKAFSSERDQWRKSDAHWGHLDLVDVVPPCASKQEATNRLSAPLLEDAPLFVPG